jgi:hypothetical protein
MLNRIVPLSLALVAAFAFSVAVAADKVEKDKPAADNVHKGVVVSVSAVDGTLTMKGTGGKEHKYMVAKDAKITCDGKECKLDDLTKGETVAVTVEKQGDDMVITKIEAKKADKDKNDK